MQKRASIHSLYTIAHDGFPRLHTAASNDMLVECDLGIMSEAVTRPVLSLLVPLPAMVNCFALCCLIHVS